MVEGGKSGRHDVRPQKDKPAETISQASFKAAGSALHPGQGTTDTGCMLSGPTQLWSHPLSADLGPNRMAHVAGEASLPAGPHPSSILSRRLPLPCPQRFPNHHSSVHSCIPLLFPECLPCARPKAGAGAATGHSVVSRARSLCSRS